MFLSVPTLALLLVVLSPSNGSASCFSGEQTIYARHSNKYEAYGTISEFYLYNRTLDANCGGDPEGWYSAHMEPGPTPGSLDEIGPAEKPCTIGDPSGPHCFYLFTEGFNAGSLRCAHVTYTPPEEMPHYFALYQVKEITLNGNPDYWDWKVDWENGGSPIGYGHCLGSSDHGKARAEIGRSGGTDTSLHAHSFTNLYAGSGGNWHDWRTVCDDDSISGWEIAVQSNGSEFYVQQGSGGCQFTPP